MPWNWFIAFALLIFSSVITALTAKKTTTAPPDPNSLSDFSFPNIDEGTPQVVVFGDVWLNGWQVLWYGNLKVDPIQQSSGGGGGGKK